MIINAIKFQAVDESMPKVWRFAKSQGNYQAFQCFHGNPLDLKQFRQALIYALTGTAAAEIKEVILQISRADSEDSWIIERGRDRLRLIKNGVELANTEVSETLLGAFFDLDEGLDTNTFGHFNLSAQDDSIQAVPIHDDHPGSARLHDMVAEAKDQLIMQLGQIFHQPFIDAVDQIHELVTHALPLWQANREILRQLRSLVAESSHAKLSDPKVFEVAERELELIKQMRELVEPLCEPANTPKLLKEKLAKCETEIKRIQKTYELLSLPSINPKEIPWEHLIKNLARVLAYRKLIETSDRVNTLAEKELGAISRDYVGTLLSLIGSDNQIIAELESCLATLRIQLDASPRPQPALSEMLSRFVKPEKPIPEEEKRDRLENARMAIDYALARLGELHGNVRDSAEKQEEALQALRERHESFVAEHGKLLKLWRKLASAQQLPESLNLKQLIGLVTQYGRLQSLEVERQKLRETLHKRKGTLQKLEDLVLEWRRISASQKDSPLSNAALLTSEALGIVRYLPKKEEALRRKRETWEKQRSLHAIHQTLLSRQKRIEDRWLKIFSDLQIPIIDIARAEWRQFFDLTAQLKAWEQIQKSSHKPPRNEEIFSDRFIDAPLSFHSCIAIESTNSHRLALLNAIEKQATTNLHVLLTTDLNLREMLVKLGVGGARSVEPAERKRRATPTASGRAQQVVSLLNQGRN